MPLQFHNLPADVVGLVAQHLSLPDINNLQNCTKKTLLAADTLRGIDPLATQALEERGTFYHLMRAARDGADALEYKRYYALQTLRFPNADNCAEALIQRPQISTPEIAASIARVTERLAKYTAVASGSEQRLRASLRADGLRDTLTCAAALQNRYLSIPPNTRRFLHPNLALRLLEHPRVRRAYRQEVISHISQSALLAAVRNPHNQQFIDALAALAPNPTIRSAILQSPQAGGRTLNNLAIRSSDPSEQLAILNHPKTDPRTKNITIERINDAQIRIQLAVNPTTSYMMLRALARSTKSGAERVAILKNPLCSSESLEHLAVTATDPLERELILNHRFATRRVFSDLLAHIPSMADVSPLLRNITTPDIALALAVPAMSTQQRSAVLAHENCKARTLFALADSVIGENEPADIQGHKHIDRFAQAALAVRTNNSTMRRAIVMSPDTTEAILSYVAMHEKQPEIRELIREHLNYGPLTHLRLAQTAPSEAERRAAWRIPNDWSTEHFIAVMHACTNQLDRCAMLEFGARSSANLLAATRHLTEIPELRAVAKSGFATAPVLHTLTRHAADESLRKTIWQAAHVNDEVLAKLVPFTHDPLERAQLFHHPEAWFATVDNLRTTTTQAEIAQHMLAHPALAPTTLVAQIETIALHPAFLRSTSAERPSLASLLSHPNVNAEVIATCVRFADRLPLTPELHALLPHHPAMNTQKRNRPDNHEIPEPAPRRPRPSGMITPQILRVYAERRHESSL